MPLITMVGLALPGLIGGAFFIETIFAWPGMGRLTFEAVGRRDYTMIMATTLMFSVLTMVSNLHRGRALRDARSAHPAGGWRRDDRHRI